MRCLPTAHTLPRSLIRWAMQLSTKNMLYKLTECGADIGGAHVCRQRLTIAIAQPVPGQRLKEACEPAFELVIADLIRMHSFYCSARERIHGMRRNA